MSSTISRLLSCSAHQNKYNVSVVVIPGMLKGPSVNFKLTVADFLRSDLRVGETGVWTGRTRLVAMDAESVRWTKK